MFPVDKRVVQSLWYPAPDVIPALCFALDDVPADVWAGAADLPALADAVEPYLKRHGAAKWDFIWSMERHFSEPYGPLPKATVTFMAGIPDMFLGARRSTAPAPTRPDRSQGILASQVQLNRTEAHDDVSVLAEPFQFEPGDDMPADYRAWLEKLFFAHGECMTPYFGEQGRGIKSMYQEVDSALMEQAPDAVSRLRFANFTNEEYRHTYQFYALYGNYDPKIPFKIYEHEKQVFRAYLDLKTDGSWLDHSIFNLLADRLGTYQAFEWVESSYAPLARVALKVVKDERGHCNMGFLHVREFMEREGSAGRAHVQKRIHEHFYPFHLAAFGGGKSKNNQMWRTWGLKQHTNDQLRAAYHTEMSLVLDRLGIAIPDFDAALARGYEAAEKMQQTAQQRMASAPQVRAAS
ncbi:MAG: Phenylacetic acid catabolic protein [Alphaproteobacteria bacterium]